MPRNAGTCCRKGCKNAVRGQQQVCDACKAKDLLCERCGKPHEGQVGTTKLCRICRPKQRGRRRGVHNPPWTDADDAFIREAYANHHAREAQRIIREHWPKRPRWSTTRRAQVIGAASTRKKDRPWVPDEDAVIRELGWMTPERIAHELRARGFPRTITAVAVRMKRTRLAVGIDTMNAGGLAEIMNVDVKTVMRWIDEGRLKAERCGTTGDNHDRWHITTPNIRAFLFAHPERYELSKLERAGSKMWFLELVSGGRISEHASDVPIVGHVASDPVDRTFALYGERVSLSALAEISGRQPAELLHRIDGAGMSVSEAAFGSDGGDAPIVEKTPTAQALGQGLGALLKKHKARPGDLAEWTKLPLGLVERLLDGGAPVILPALSKCAEVLDADLSVAIAPKRRSWET